MKTLVLITVFLASFVGFAQTSRPILPFNFGIWVDYSGNFLSEDLKWYYLSGNAFKQVGSISNNKFGSGFGFGGIVNYPILDNLFITGRVGYNSFSSNLDYYYFDYNTLTYTTFTDATKVSCSYLEFTPGVQFYPKSHGFEYLYLLGGFEIGSYLNKEFTNNQIGLTGEFQNVKTRIAFILGLGYTFQISDNVYLSPEVSFRIPLTRIYNQDIVDARDVYNNVIAYHNEQINKSQLRLGISLTFSLKPKEDEPIIPEAPGEVGFKEVLALDEKGNLAPATQINVVDTRYQEYFPIVPYIFFEENSAKPARNTQSLISNAEAGAFDPNNLPMDALEINRNTLEIICWRLKNNPRADLTILGTTDGYTIEKNNKQLAFERANFVKDYLVKNCNINEQRINTRTSQFPSKPSTSNVPEGVAENRRAELSSSNPAIFEPLLIESENQRIANPGSIQFVPYANVQDSITFWEINIYQGGNLLKRYNGKGKPQILHWNIKPNELSAGNIPVDYILLVETINGKKYKASGSLPTEYFSQTKKKAEELPDVTITKFSLVLFDFDKADVSAQDQDIINKLVLPNIKFNSTVKIYGYTDKIGDDDYNLKLASRRAAAVEKIIRAKRKDVKIETYGIGERQLLFDNDIPTGRHLSRTVQIVIVTPK